MMILLAIIAVGIGTYLCRAVFVLVLANRRLPRSALLPLQFVAPATLAALVAALLIDDQGAVAIGVPELAALVSCSVVAYFTRSHVYTLVVGMAVFLVLHHGM